jgi:hypothetical protein
LLVIYMFQQGSPFQLQAEHTADAQFAVCSSIQLALLLAVLHCLWGSPPQLAALQLQR